jgi:hypothetical protein
MVLLLCQNDHVNPNQHSVLNDTLSSSYRQKFLPGWNIFSITVKIKGQLTTTHKQSQRIPLFQMFEANRLLAWSDGNTALLATVTQLSNKIFLRCLSCTMLTHLLFPLPTRMAWLLFLLLAIL